MTTSSNSKNLAERHLLITGASSGIGLSLLHEAVSDGAECAVIVKDSAEADVDELEGKLKVAEHAWEILEATEEEVELNVAMVFEERHDIDTAVCRTEKVLCCDVS